MSEQNTGWRQENRSHVTPDAKARNYPRYRSENGITRPYQRTNREVVVEAIDLAAPDTVDEMVLEARVDARLEGVKAEFYSPLPGHVFERGFEGSEIPSVSIAPKPKTQALRTDEDARADRLAEAIVIGLARRMGIDAYAYGGEIVVRAY
ncbi:MAG: hypothetical protein M3141_10640 [Actinomycetota bacterium]|nr:hypothetical protein [Actinomycetota bacterium]